MEVFDYNFLATILIFVLFFIYFIRFALIFFGKYRELRRTKKFLTKTDKFNGFISVIIPARNEEQNIEKAVLSVANCNFDKANYEIIVVNDRSTDQTAEIAEKLKEQIPNLKVLHLTEDSKSPNLKGKAGALQVGIDASQGELILLTDADCQVNPNWIEYYARVFSEPGVGLALSYSTIDGAKLFDKIQGIEWLYLHTMALAGIGLNYPLGGYGNDMAFTREAFNSVGGYKEIKFSVTEDFALIKAIFKKGWKIHHLMMEQTSVSTVPEPNFASYLEQHRRWALGGMEHGWVAVVFVLTTLSIWIGAGIALFIGNYVVAIALPLLRGILDIAIFITAIFRLRKKHFIAYIPFAIVFFQLFELFLPLTMFNRRIVWKGQIFKQ